MKTYCDGSGSEPAEVRHYPSPVITGAFGKCGTCERILKVGPGGRLRKHSVRGANTASHDRTMETLWEYSKTEKQLAAHFALGLPVFIRRGATPAGWDDLANPDNFVPDHWYEDDYLRTFQIQSIGDDGTFEVMGWFWNPQDLVAQ
jgi:hypothetical protein